MLKYSTLAVVVALSLLACSKPRTEGEQSGRRSNTQSPSPAKPAPLDHWDDFKFGMSFDDAIIAEAGIHWNPDTFKSCRDEMPVKGCELYPDEDNSYRPSIAGMALLPSLNFNEKGELTDVDLRRTFKAGVTPTQCEAIHARLLDELANRFGEPRLSKEKGPELRKSPGGHSYHRTTVKGGLFVAGEEDFRIATDGSKISLLTIFTPASEYVEAECRPGIEIEGPKKLTRRPIILPN